MHLGHQLVVHAHPALRVVLVDVVLERVETQLVSVLEVSVVLRVLLDRVVRQMHEGIVDVLQVDAELAR